MTDQKDQTQANNPTPDQPTRIPVTFSGSTPSAGAPSTNAQITEDVEERAEILDRIKRMEVKEPAEDESVDDLVKEYEARYSAVREKDRLSSDSMLPQEPSEPKIGSRAVEDIWADMPLPSSKPKPRSAPIFTGATEQERTWAALAHASMVLTVMLGLFSGGFLAVMTIFIPLGIYFAFRQRSEFVAFHALQAFTLQAIGTVGWVIVLLVGVLIGVIISTVMAITVLGLPVAFLAVLATIIFAAASLVMPLGMIVYGGIAAWEAYQGVRYKIPFLGDWIDKQMHSGFLKSF